MSLIAVLVLALLAAVATAISTPDTPATSRTPKAVASALADAFLANQSIFINWEGGFQYGGCVAADGLYEAAAAALADRDQTELWTAAVDAWSDAYLRGPPDNVTEFDCAASLPYGGSNVTKQCAWQLADGKTPIPHGDTVGDHLGLYPIIYLRRFLRRRHHLEPKQPSTSGRDANVAPGLDLDLDLAVALNAAEQQVIGWPTHLPDGTIARSGFGPDARYPLALWADDQFMGLTLLARLATCPSCDGRGTNASGGIDLATRRRYAMFVGRQQRAFTRRMRDARDGLFYHGVGVRVPSRGTGMGTDAGVGASSAEEEIEDEELMPSCCKWGRANGWGMLSHIEVLNALDFFLNTSKGSVNASGNSEGDGDSELRALRDGVLADYQSRATSLLAFQDAETGMWRQVLNETWSYPETSATAMAVASMATAVHRGWLPAAQFLPSIRAGWAGLAARVDMRSGVVSGVCMGTGIMPNASAYNARGTDFFQSCPGGVGAVLRAAAAVAQLPSRS